MSKELKGTMSIGEFAKRVGVSPLTVRRWIYAGKLKPLKTVSGRYRFTDEHLKQALSFKGKPLPRKTVIYARVSTPKQKDYLENQINLCKQYAVSKGYSIDEVITDTASSFNFKRKGLNKLLDLVLSGEVDRVILYSKDRLSRIAFELFENLFAKYGTKIEVVDNSENLHSQEQIKDAVEELISFVHYITSKIYGSRSYKNQKLKKCVREVLNETDLNA